MEEKEKWYKVNLSVKVAMAQSSALEGLLAKKWFLLFGKTKKILDLTEREAQRRTEAWHGVYQEHPKLEGESLTYNQAMGAVKLLED